MTPREQTAAILLGLWTFFGVFWYAAETTAARWRRRRAAARWQTWVTRRYSVTEDTR